VPGTGRRTPGRDVRPARRHDPGGAGRRRCLRRPGGPGTLCRTHRLRGAPAGPALLRCQRPTRGRAAMSRTSAAVRATGRVRWRLPLLASGGLALLAGLYASLQLLGFRLPRPALAEVHGPVMVLGFVGALVALERAVALGTRWGFAAPAAAGAGGLALVVAGPTLPGKLLLAAAGVLLLGVYRALWRRQPGEALLAQAAGAFAWYAATLLWLAGPPVPELVPWLATFLVA